MDGEHVRSHRARPSPGILTLRGCKLKTNMNNAITPIVFIACFSRVVFATRFYRGSRHRDHWDLPNPPSARKSPAQKLQKTSVAALLPNTAFLPLLHLLFFIFFCAYSASVYATHIKLSTRD